MDSAPLVPTFFRAAVDRMRVTRHAEDEYRVCSKEYAKFIFYFGDIKKWDLSRSIFNFLNFSKVESVANNFSLFMKVESTTSDFRNFSKVGSATSDLR